MLNHISFCDRIALAFCVLVAAAALFGCAGFADPRGQLDLAFDAPAQLAYSDVPPAKLPAPLPEPPQSLLIWPDPELLPALRSTIADYYFHFGLEIEVAEGGIPIVVEPEVRYNGSLVDAIAHYDSPCAGYDCGAGHGVRIPVAQALLEDKAWAMGQSLRHELGHVFSGWGRAAGVPIHLAPQVGVMSPGCVDRVCMPWSDADADMICAGAPCAWIRL